MQRLQNVVKYLVLFDILHLLLILDSRRLPTIKHISLHYSLKKDNFNPKKVFKVLLFLEVLSGQRPVLIKANTSFDFIKIRKGSLVSCKVTLNHFNSFHFIDKFAMLVMPTMIRFEGLSFTGFDREGNLHQSIRDPTSIFSESLKNHRLFKGLKGFLQINIAVYGSNSMKSLVLFSLLQLKFLV
jgi:ribosomal protein L5